MKKFLNNYGSWLGRVALFGLILLLPGQALAGKNVFKFFEDMEIHGFVSTSYSYNTNTPASQTNCGLTGNCLRIFDQDDNSFKLDIAELVFLKETPDAGDIGFRVDLAFGFSLPEVEQSAASSPVIPRPGTNASGHDDFNLQQAFVSWNAPVGNGLQLDMGKFITHIGSEVIEGYDGWNWNFSRSFLFGLTIPFIHTGIRTSYEFNDQWSAMASVSNGFAVGETDTNKAKTLGLQLGYNPTDNVGILANWIGGNEPGNSDFLSVWDFVIDVGATNELSLQANIVFGSHENAGAGFSTAKWWGYALYGRYDFSKLFSLNVRGEYLNDSDGFATGGFGGTVGTNLWEFTITPEFRIHNNFVVRLEYRHDDASTLAFEDSNGNGTGSQDTVSFNALVHF
jgi:hypothetical protein